MPDNDRISIDSLTQAPELSSGDVTAVVHTVNGVKSTYKATMTLLGTFLNKILQYSSDLHTNSKTIIGAINEINDGGGGGSAVILYGTSAPTSQQGSDGNLYVQYTEGTGGASDVVDALYVKLDSEWCQISTGGGGGGTAASVSFDDTNVEFEADDVQEAFESIVKTLTWAQYQSLSAAEKNNGTIYYITDRNTPISYNDLTDKPTIPTDAEQLPITSDSATNTKDYIDSKTASASYSINNIDVYRVGNVVFFNIITGTNSTDANGLIVSGGSNSVIRAGYRPPNNVNVIDTVTMARMTCNYDGTVWTNKVSQTGLSIRISACWITNDAFPT